MPWRRRSASSAVSAGSSSANIGGAALDGQTSRSLTATRLVTHRRDQSGVIIEPAPAHRGFRLARCERVLWHRARDLRARLPGALRLVVPHPVQQGLGKLPLRQQRAAAQSAVQRVDRVRLLSDAGSWMMESGLDLESNRQPSVHHHSDSYSACPLPPHRRPALGLHRRPPASRRPARSRTTYQRMLRVHDLRRLVPVDGRAAAVAQRGRSARGAAPAAEGVSRRPLQELSTSLDAAPKPPSESADRDGGGRAAQ